MFRLLLQLFLFYFGIFGISCQNPEVEIPQGRLFGAVRNDIDGGSYYSFQNIPYGRPPIGDLRFKAPEPADSWEGTRDATQDLPWCVQQGNMMGQEDCLYLNVYTPDLPEEDDNQLPVMVWIHGGGFTAGSAGEMLQGPQYLLTKDVIVVTINYRVGIFGFLSLDDPNLGVTGNAGMKDQVLALEWVRDNIEHFGGNPNDVTIFGESAGSLSIQLLLLSPMATGLFHKAIAQSGDALSPLLGRAPRNTGELIAQALSIQTENWEDMLASLQETAVNDLALAELGFNTNIFRFFVAPIVEISANGTFLERDLIDIIRSGDYNPVPLIMGVVEAEGLLFQYYSRSLGDNLLIEDFTEFVPREFNAEGTPLENLIAFVIRQFYYGNTPPSRDNITGAVELSTDYFFAFSSYRAVREYLRTTNNPIYFYYFTAITNLNYLKQMDETIAAYPVAAHGDDTGYVWYMPALIPSFNAGSVEEHGYRNMIDLLTNFAIYDNPTPEGSDFIWEPVTEDQFNYLHIGTCETYPVLNSVFTPERMEFWWALFEQYASR